MGDIEGQRSKQESGSQAWPYSLLLAAIPDFIIICSAQWIVILQLLSLLIHKDRNNLYTVRL